MTSRLDVSQRSAPDDAALARKNYTLKEDIRDYWTKRAETFDQSAFHGMKAPGEKDAWLRLIGGHVQKPQGSHILEIAYGTGEITAVLLALGFQVTGVDFAEAMQLKAKLKHGPAKNLSLLLGDAEDTRQPDETFDAVVMRHLVWTLVDPETAFRDWFRVLRPGGRLVVIDGNFAETSLSKRFRRKLSDWMARFDGTSEPPIDWPAHEAIMRQVFFHMGLTPERLQPMLEAVGFSGFEVEDLEFVRRVQRRSASLSKRLKLGLSDSFIMSCAKPSADGARSE